MPSETDHRAPVIVTAWTHSTAALTSKQPSNQRKSTSDTPGRSEYRSPSRDQSSSRAIIVAKQKSTPPKWPPQQTTRRRCRNPHGEDAAIHWSPGCGRLRDDAPKEEEDVKAPSSPDPEDLRFPSEAKAVGREEEHHTTATLPRKSTTPTDVAVARSDKGRTQDFFRRCSTTTCPHQRNQQTPSCQGQPRTGRGIQYPTTPRRVHHPPAEAASTKSGAAAPAASTTSPATPG